MTIRFSPGAFNEIRAHLESVYPDEGAGFLLGYQDGELRTVESALPQPNEFEEDQRGRRYLIEPKDMLAAEKYADEHGYQILGIFHSHPDHPAEPSSYDLEWSLPWFSYVITSVESGKAVTTRGWRLTDDRDRFYEEKIEAIPVIKSDK
jgi:proteasome lid subunit RPN8/RPN11